MDLLEGREVLNDDQLLQIKLSVDLPVRIHIEGSTWLRTVVPSQQTMSILVLDIESQIGILEIGKVDEEY